MEQQQPYSYATITSSSPFIKEKSIIFTIDQCGFFFCQEGEGEILLGSKIYHISKGHLFIYVAGSQLHILKISADLKGIIVKAELNFILPIINKAINSVDILYLRENPYMSLSKEQYTHLEQLLFNIRQRMEQKNNGSLPSQKLSLLQAELAKSWGQIVCYELLNIYFSNQPISTMPQDKKDKIFQNFMLNLFRHYHKERDVSFYANKQCLSPRYFSTIIKEKSGSSALQWIIRLVITEAKQLLESTDLSIKEIASNLNFPTQSFFGKYFKQYVGISPKEYRAQRIKQPFS